ncbi:MAG: hypothetical protein IPP29_20235 [Bacteroidetes bacterium]|nr:hypothetical protein [Bacteroidota bacterium]
MKNYLKLFLAINLVSASNTFTQDLINPYQNFLGTLAAQLNNPILNCKYQYPPQTNYNAPNPEGMLFSPAARTVLQSSGYDGEYQIILSDFPWLYDKGPIVIPIPLFASLAKTYTIEAASFPFTTPCWDQPSSCVYPAYGSLAERHFFMPDDQYNTTTKKWNLLTNSVSDNFIGSPLYITAPTTLVSMRYVTDEVNSFTSPFIPHTIIKHTIYLHCTSSPTSDIINQFTFYYDNTRGALRYYPFKIDNYSTSGNAGVWDILFRPEVVTDIRDKIGAYVCDYSQVSNADWFDGGTIDYFPFQYSNHLCANNPLPSSQFVSTYDASPLNGEEFRARSHNFVFQLLIV